MDFLAEINSFSTITIPPCESVNTVEYYVSIINVFYCFLYAMVHLALYHTAINPVNYHPPIFTIHPYLSSTHIYHPPIFILQILMNVLSVHIDVLKTVRIQLEATFVIVMQDLSELSMVMTVKVSVHALMSCVLYSAK